MNFGLHKGVSIKTKLFILIVFGITFLTSCSKNRNDPTYSILEKRDKLSPFFNSKRAFAYNQSSLYKENIEKCVYAKEIADSCTTKFLPLLGQITNNRPTINQIMDRLVVSHKILGARFKRFLEHIRYDHPVFNLFKALTAIVISNKVNPSFYLGSTATIYINSNYLSFQHGNKSNNKNVRNDVIYPYSDFSPFQHYNKSNNKKVINDIVDARINYGKRFNFFSSIRYSATTLQALCRGAEDVDICKIERSLSSLLFHELAHANDYLPHYSHNKINKNNSVFEAIYSRYNNNKLVSMKIINKNTSSILKTIAQALYYGDEINSTFYHYTADQIVNLFEDDNSVALYGYSNDKEDLAITFQDALDLCQYNVIKHFSIYDKQNKRPVKTFNNRILNKKIKDKALFIISELLPKNNYCFSRF